MLENYCDLNNIDWYITINILNNVNNLTIYHFFYNKSLIVRRLFKNPGKCPEAFVNIPGIPIKLPWGLDIGLLV